jgi:HTH-type transcriptional regulator / antitoxin HipB
MATTKWSEVRRRRPLTTEGRREYERTRLAIDVADQVRALRTSLGLTQEQLAEQMGTRQPVIARLEAGGSPPSLRTLERLADVLHADITVKLSARAS